MSGKFAPGSKGDAIFHTGKTQGADLVLDFFLSSRILACEWLTIFIESRTTGWCSTSTLLRPFACHLVGTNVSHLLLMNAHL